MLQVAVTRFHPFPTVRKEQYAFIRCHGIYPFPLVRYVIPACCLVMAYKLPVLLILLKGFKRCPAAEQFPSRF